MAHPGPKMADPSPSPNCSPASANPSSKLKLSWRLDLGRVHLQATLPGRARAGAQALARQGPLNFTCASVTVRHFIRDTAEDCRKRCCRTCSETVGDMPLLSNGQHLHALDHGGQLIISLICHTCAPRVCPHTLQILNHQNHRTGQRHGVGQVVFSQLVFICSPGAL